VSEPAKPAPTLGRSREVWRAIATPPNLISLGRVPLAAAYLLTEDRTARVAILLAAALSDFLDGWAARRFGAGSRLGEVLDPATDKIFVVTALATHLGSGVLATWQLGLLLLRDLYSVMAYAIAAAFRLPIRFRARMSGKIVTNLQIVAVLVLTIVPSLASWIVVATAAASIWAIADYTAEGLRGLRRGRSAG